MEQIPFSLEAETSYAPENFLISEANKVAKKWVDTWPEWPEKGLIVFGQSGVGKTHWGHVWAEKANAYWADARKIEKDVFLNHQAIVFDNFCPESVDEEGLFHLINHFNATGKYFVLLSNSAPSQWQIKLKDLDSRLSLLPVARIEVADNALLESIFIKLLNDKQLNIDPTVVSYILTHFDRSVERLSQLVKALDEEALKHKRNITLPFVKKIIESFFIEKPQN